MNARAYDAAFARLAKSKFRSRLHLSEADRKYIAEKGCDIVYFLSGNVMSRDMMPYMFQDINGVC
jgi:hypothetical protein